MLIGLAGRAGVGKTTIAKMLHEKENYHVKAFGTPVKEALAVMTGLPMEYFTDILKKEEELPFGMSPRRLMQLFATEFVREMVHPDFWVLRMEEVIGSMGGLSNIVLDDCRFQNEVSMVRKMKGVVIHLDRYYGSATRHVNHRSEEGLKVLPEDIIVQSYDCDQEYTYKELKRKLSEFEKKRKLSELKKRATTT